MADPSRLWRRVEVGGDHQSSGQGASKSAPSSVTVVVCVRAELTWASLLRAVESLRAQRLIPDQCVVVIDHNEQLFRRAQVSLPSDVEVLANEGPTGLTGARNTGLLAARGDVVAFLDGGAEADPGWLAELLAQYEEPNVAGAGGRTIPVWPGRRPAWFPPEFHWVLGCSSSGSPETVAPVRNLRGTAMSFRRSLFDEVGAFDPGTNRSRLLPLGYDKAEFAFRVRRSIPGAELVHVPGAVVRHHVEPEQARIGYFFSRCYLEGVSIADEADGRRPGAALPGARSYVLTTLPRGFADGLRDVLRGDAGGLARSMMIVAGLFTTTSGYLFAVLSSRRQSTPRLEPFPRHTS